jgi:curved DNA-binding protein
MSGRDLYAVLGVSRSASAEEIRRAHRKLARQYHPDVNKAADAQKKFAEIQHAYDVLSDEKKKGLYDQYGEAGLSGEAAAAGARGGPRGWTGPGGNGGGFKDFDAEDLESMFDTFFGGRTARPGKGRSGRRATSRVVAEDEGEPLRHEMLVTFMTAARGGTEHLRLTTGGRPKVVEVKIPAGIHDGAQLRVPGGSEGVGIGQDIVLTVRVGEHPLFRREAGQPLDLTLELPLTIAEATNGATVTVPTLEGRVELKVPAGSASGKRLRLRGLGIKDAAGKIGDMHVVIQIVPPAGDRLTPGDRQALEEISAKSGAVRHGAEWDKVR